MHQSGCCLLTGHQQPHRRRRHHHRQQQVMDIEDMDPEHEMLMDQDSLDYLPAPTVTSITTVAKHQNQVLDWHHQVNLMGEKCQNIRIHVCELCTNPILVYGRLV